MDDGLKIASLDCQAQVVRASGLFDASWYLARYPDVAALAMDPVEHYLRIGARLRRNPGPRFDTGHYLRTYRDVAASGMNPLVHYIRHGRKEQRLPLPPAPVAASFDIAIDVVVPVFNALEDAKKCLTSVRDRRDGFRVRVIVVNDGSGPETSEWLRDFCADTHGFELVEHERNRGYTAAVNTGLQLSAAPYVVTLNSDAIVTRGWLKGMVRCMLSGPEVGIVGPLSNAASWQNIPELLGEDGKFAINALPKGMSPDDMASLVAVASERSYPRTNFVNGFCFMIRREVLDTVGYMDEEAFPVGYGEENDFCIRSLDAGFALAIADDTYVFHSKSKSFGHARREEYSRQGADALRRKHGADKYKRLVDETKSTGPMDSVRRQIRSALDRMSRFAGQRSPDAMRVLFLLPVKGGGGGAHSVVQEVVEMRRLGVCAHVAVRAENLDSFRTQYEDMPGIASTFVGFTDADLLRVASGYDVVVGTIYTSMQMVHRVCRAMPHILPAYYVQDYEPLFSPRGSREWKVAMDSYALVPHAVLFAKTHWIIEKVQSEHGVVVNKVEPSIDHTVYRLQPCRRDGRIHIAAMIRPATPRRGAERTMRVFSALARRQPGRLAFHLFGCDPDEEGFIQLARDFEFEMHGRLLRPQVAALLARCDLFVDLSDYQAFGRTSLEAMACGCAAVVPVHGGGDEYAVHGVNALVVDSLDESACIRAIDELLHGEDATLHRMQAQGVVTAAKYSVHRAAVSELDLLARSLPAHRKLFPAPDARIIVAPSTTTGPSGGMITGSGYVRVVLPYFAEPLLRECVVRMHPSASLPMPGEAGALLLQRDVPGIALASLQEWLPSWRAGGGRLVYEIDDDLLDAEALCSRGYTGDTRELGEKVKWLVKSADVVTVSTQPLADRLADYNSNVRVVPNRIDRRLWRLDIPRDHTSGEFARDKRTVRIGYIGTPTHDKDLDVVTGAMRRIETEFAGRVEIEVIGGFELREPAFGKRVGLPRRRDYPAFVSWLHQRVHWDIGIIPLANDCFSQRKSYVKFLEYAALDMAIVCSEAVPYEPVAKDGENALVVPNEEEFWYEAVRRLIEDGDLRLRLAGNARRMVQESHTIDHGVSDHLGLLAGLFAPVPEPAAKVH